MDACHYLKSVGRDDVGVRQLRHTLIVEVSDDDVRHPDVASVVHRDCKPEFSDILHKEAALAILVSGTSDDIHLKLNRGRSD
jgi:hypothetical protein